jgi:hypothetical protein
MRLSRIEDELCFGVFEFLDAHVELKSLRKGTSMIFHTLYDENGSCAVLDVENG